MKRIAVYCGADTGNDQTHQEATIALAHYLVNHQLELSMGAAVLV